MSENSSTKAYKSVYLYKGQKNGSVKFFDKLEWKTANKQKGKLIMYWLLKILNAPIECRFMVASNKCNP